MSICRICGKEGNGQPFATWVKDTFTNYDLLKPGEIICNDCLFWFEQRSTELQRRMGKDKPQRMQNYTHFVIGGTWEPVSKSNKKRMAELLLTYPFPELAAIAVSGQKHLAFRARRNAPGQAAGWVQFEQQAAWVDPRELAELMRIVEKLYTVFSKGEIETGRYFPARIMAFGVGPWHDLDERIKPIRSTVLFQIALFLAQRSDNDGAGHEDDGGNAAKNNLAGSATGLQVTLQDDDLGAVRERDSGGVVYVEPGSVYQPDLFAAAGGPGTDTGRAGRSGRNPKNGKR